MSYPSFGEPAPGLPVQHRPGAYALILNPAGQLAVMRLREGWYLPGGGQEAGEGLETCLERELREETGHGIELLWYLGQAGQYISLSQYVIFKLGHFFLAEFSPEPPVAVQEHDHELHWLEPSEALTCLRHANQVWAVEKLLALMQA